MKTCPECNFPIPDGIKYCVYCGTRTNTSNLIKANRAFFFFTPIAILLLCLCISYEAGSNNFLEVGISLSGIANAIYFLGAILFGGFRVFFKIPMVSGSFFKASFTSFINSITAIFAVFSIKCLFLNEFFEKQGPSNLLKYYVLLFFIVFLIVQLFETFAIGLKAKIVDNPDLKNSKIINIVYNYLYLEIPFDFIIITAICFYLTPYPSKIAFASQALYGISSTEKANQYIDTYIEKSPENDKIFYLKSKLLTEQEQSILQLNPENDKKALDYAKKASDMKPNVPLYKYHLSSLLELNKNIEEAIKTASEAAYLASDDVALWQNLGNINQKYERYSEAINAYKKALTIDSTDPIVLNNLSYTLLYNNQELDTALKYAKKSVELLPNAIFNRDTLAWAYYKNKHPLDALEAINIIYKDKKEIEPEVDFHRIVILDENGLLNNSIEYYDKMLVKPEISTNKKLFLQIIEAREKAEIKQKGKQ